ncbi:hypothetical protein C8J45_1011040 [Sphingomonas sp. PP-CE-3G-477]|nr:hypothetical protein C8J45_1011040 [Sphingomonas sp. PP-CE-3G-477]
MPVNCENRLVGSAVVRRLATNIGDLVGTDDATRKGSEPENYVD